MKLSQGQLEQLEREIFHATLPPLTEELCRVDFGDKRLGQRHQKVVELLSRAPEKSFPQMVSTDTELTGIYRFFNHGAVSPERLLQPHIEATCERCDAVGVALAVHDTTAVSLGTKGTRRGLGRLNDGGNGYFLHPTLAVTADGGRVPLGLLHVETLVRSEPPDEKDKKEKWRSKAEDRESLRWWRGIEECESLFAGSATELIHLIDREGDDYELLARALMAQYRFVIRMKFNRLVAESEALPASEQGQEAQPHKVKEALAQASVVLQREVYLSARKQDRSTEKRKTHPAREGREATLCASAMRLSLRRPDSLAKTAPELPLSIELNVVRVWEESAPAGVEPVEWYLLTSEPIATAEDIAKIIDYYRARWVIEEFFKALKTGCSIEKRQFEALDTLLTVLAMFLPIAWRLLLLRSLARDDPALPASTVLSDVQLEILRLARPKLRLPQHPTIREALLGVAALGGHLKHNGHPGWLVLGRGFRKLLSLEEGWMLARYGDVSNH